MSYEIGQLIQQYPRSRNLTRSKGLMGGLCRRKCVSDHFALSSSISFSWVGCIHLHLYLHCHLGKGVLGVSVVFSLLRPEGGPLVSSQRTQCLLYRLPYPTILYSDLTNTGLFPSSSPIAVCRKQKPSKSANIARNLSHQDCTVCLPF